MAYKVVDSSIIIKWLNQTNEQNVDKADLLLRDASKDKTALLAPAIAKYEVGNVLLTKKKLTPSEAYISLGTAYALPITFVEETEELANETYTIAYNLGITYYDASFLSLAKKYNAALITENMKHQGRTKDLTVIALKDY